MLTKNTAQGIRQQTAASPAMHAFRKTACQIAKTALIDLCISKGTALL